MVEGVEEVTEGAVGKLEEEEELVIILKAVGRHRSVLVERSRSDSADPFFATKITRQPRKIV